MQMWEIWLCRWDRAEMGNEKRRTRGQGATNKDGCGVRQEGGSREANEHRWWRISAACGGMQKWHQLGGGKNSGQRAAMETKKTIRRYWVLEAERSRSYSTEQLQPTRTMAIYTEQMFWELDFYIVCVTSIIIWLLAHATYHPSHPQNQTFYSIIVIILINLFLGWKWHIQYCEEIFQVKTPSTSLLHKEVTTQFFWKI